MAPTNSFAALQELTDKLAARLANFREKSEYPYRVRASSQPFCPREYYYRIKASTKVKRETSMASSLYMEQGTAIHNVVQRTIPLLKDTGDLVGNWECPHCGWKTQKLCTYTFAKQQKKCRCWDPLKYIEIDFKDEALGTGHTDGAIIFHIEQTKVPVVLEIKSTGTSKLADITKPTRVHLLQAHQYVYLIRKHNDFPVNHIWFLYVGREPENDVMRYKSLLVQADETLIQIQLWLNQLARKAVDTNWLPFGICKTQCSTSFCDFAERCFEQGGNPFPTDDASIKAIDYYWPREAPIKIGQMLNAR